MPMASMIAPTMAVRPVVLAASGAGAASGVTVAVAVAVARWASTCLGGVLVDPLPELHLTGIGASGIRLSDITIEPLMDHISTARGSTHPRKRHFPIGQRAIRRLRVIARQAARRVQFVVSFVVELHQAYFSSSRA